MTDPQPPYPPPPGPQQPYGQQQYPQPPYPPPPGQPYGAPQYPYPPSGGGYPPAPSQGSTTSGFAIAALIFGIIGGVLFSVIFGIIALGKTKGGRQRGRGMAIAGLVLSALWIAVFLVAVIVVVVADSGQSTVRATEIRIGDCINTPALDGENVASLPRIPCDQPHEGEVYAMDKVTSENFPGQTVLENNHRDRCVSALQAVSPNAAADPTVDVSILYPTQETWEVGDRDVVCIAVTRDKQAGTLRQQFG